MAEPLPTFPPLLTGHALAKEIMPADWARARIAKGKLGAGDLAWSEDVDNLRFVLVLEPEVAKERCGEILFVAMVAIGDAIGALCPPELAITYCWPSIVLANEARFGFVDLVISDSDQGGVPDWMVLSVDLCLKPRRGDPEPGETADRTTLWDEGCGQLGRTRLLEAVSRHFLSLIHGWSEDGFGSIHSQWWGRRSQNDPLADGAISQGGDVRLIGLDETGNALISADGETRSVPTFEALAQLLERDSGRS